MREWLARLRDWLRRDRLDAELIEELRFHHEQLERDARAEGVAGEEAVSRARRRLGDTLRVREAARDRWSVPWLDQLQQDVRYALRGLRRTPGFTATVVVTIGLGVGANAAMLGVVDRLMFRPPPHLREPASVHRVYLEIGGGSYVSHVFPYARYLDLRNLTASFSETAAFHSVVLAIGSGEAARERQVAAVSASFFDFFEAPPAFGRYFTTAEDTPPSGAHVVVLSHAFWRAEFGERDVIGEVIEVGNVASTIVGVTPAGFTGVAEGAPPVVFVPLTTFGRNEGGGNGADYFEAYNWDWTEMIVRRKTGVTVTAATLDLTNAFRRSRDVARARHSWMPRTDRAPARAIAGPLREAAGPNPGLEARTLVWLTAVAGIVLLIACANVANLVLARALRRQREVALRLALGVTRRRLAAQSLTEVLVLTLLGCVAGIAIAAWAGASLHKLIMPDGSVYSPWSDGRTLGIAIATTLVAGLLTGLAPLAFAVRADINTTLKWAARQGSYQHTRARAALLVVQGALSVLLLTGAALFVRSLENVRDMRLGYDADSLLLVRVHSRGVALDEHEQAALRERLLERALAIASVQRGAWVSTVPFLGSSTRGLAVPGIDSVPLLGRFDYQTVSSDYFATMGTRIVRGRPFNETDRAGSAPVAVVSEGMARTIWPGQDALGQCIRVSGWNERADTMPCTTVVGIAEDALYDPEADRPFRYYLPIEHFPHDGGSLLVLRVGAVPATLAEEVRGALQRAMPGPSYVTAGPARLHIDAQRRPWRLGAAVLSAFGVLALIVAAVGSYGVIAYSVAQRMHELGVRIALGAQRRDVARLVLGLGVRFALAGVLLGNALALTVAPWIEPLLFRQSARDPAVFGAVATLLVAVALVASAVPAIRATHADPNTVLRAE